MASLNQNSRVKCSVSGCDNEPCMLCECTIPKSFICETHISCHVRNKLSHEKLVRVLPREKVEICLDFLRDHRYTIQEKIKTTIDDYTKTMIKIKNELDEEIQNLAQSQYKVNAIFADIQRNHIIPNKEINEEILKLESDKCLDFLRNSDLFTIEIKHEDMNDGRNLGNSSNFNGEIQSNISMKEESKDEEKKENNQNEITKPISIFSNNRAILPVTQNDYEKIKREKIALIRKNHRMLNDIIFLYKDYLYYKKKINNENEDNEPSPRKIQKVKPNLCHSIFHWNTLLFFEDSTKTLLCKHFDIFLGGSERKTLERKELELPEPIGRYISMCQLPDEEVFCFGNCYNNTYTGFTFTINIKSFIVHILPQGTPIYKTSTCYYNGCVYAFGGERHGNKFLNFAEKYDITRLKWHRIKDLPIACSQCSIAAFNENIYITGINYDKVYIYNPLANEYSPKLELIAGLNKLLFCKNTRIYVLQGKEIIIWNKDTVAPKVKKVDQDWTTEISYKTLYGQNLYFACENGQCFKYNQKCLLTPAFSIFDN